MSNYYKRYGKGLLLSLLAAVMLVPAACTKVDDQLGGNLIPDGDRMRVRVDTVETGYKTYNAYYDSIRSMNLGKAFLGSRASQTFGSTTTAAMMRYLPAKLSDTVRGFGYKAQADSMKIYLTMSFIGGDSTVEQSFGIYALKRALDDTTYYVNVPYEEYIADEPLFTFTVRGDTTERFLMLDPTPAGRTFMQELVDTPEEIYETDTLFFNEFKGICIRRTADSPEDAALYSTDLALSYLSLYAHNYDSTRTDTPTVKDTVGLTYHFIYSDRSDIRSVSSVRHDYTGTPIRPDTTLSVPVTYVQGMGGVCMQLEFTDELFAGLESLKERPGDVLVVNQARLSLPLQERGAVIYDAAPDRLGAYYNYSKLRAIPDYNYYGEKEQSLTLAYGGYLNRSHGTYLMDITSFLQRQLKIESMSGTEREDALRSTPRRITFGLGAYDFFTGGEAVLEGEDGTRPVSMILTYTLVR